MGILQGSRCRIIEFYSSLYSVNEHCITVQTVLVFSFVNVMKVHEIM